MGNMKCLIKRVFCQHKWEVVRLNERFAPLNGFQTYLRCEKCGKMKKHIFVEYEGGGYK